MNAYRAIAFVLLLLLAIPTGVADELLRLDVTHDAGRYRLQADLLIHAPAARVRRLLTDYAHLTDLNRSIKRSETGAAAAPYDTRVKTEIRACVPVYCRTLRRVEDVRESQDRLIAVIVPAQSDFKYGRTEWLFQDRGDQVLVQYRSEIEPAFAVPPLLGPALIKQGIERELRALLDNLERLAEAG